MPAEQVSNPRPRPSPTDRALAEYVLTMKRLYPTRGADDRADKSPQWLSKGANS